MIPQGGTDQFARRTPFRGRLPEGSRVFDFEFHIRRFLLRVLPEGLMRIRRFGFLANRCKKQYLARCRELLGVERQTPPAARKSTRELMIEVTGLDPTLCPACRFGTLVVIAQLSALPVAASRAQRSPPPLLDSS